MKKEDIPAGIKFCRQASWNQLEKDWEMFIELDPDRCIVAVVDDHVAGTAATIRYNRFSWIGMVLVDNEYRRRGIGQQLLGQILDILKNEQLVKLDATPQGRELYLQLNFKDECSLSRMVATNIAPHIPDPAVKPVHVNILDKIAAYDQLAFGANREKLLELLLRNGSSYAFYTEQKGAITGYCLGRKGYKYTHIGPVIADDMHIAQKLVTAALRNCKDAAVVMDVFDQQAEWMQWMASAGFSRERSFIRMYLGTANFQGSLNKQFAITGPEFG